MRQGQREKAGESDFRLRKVVVRVCLVVGLGLMMSRVMAKLSEIVRSVNMRL